MQPNPVLKKLGFANDDRVVIIHTDDIGMCQASVAAFADLHAFGLISSGAIMVPCPWSLAAASYAREHPEADLGVHITLTSEWSTYRWGPLSTRDAKTGLLDEEGYFHHLAASVQESAGPEAVLTEMEAQVQRAYAMGLQPTHVDTHMGTVAHPKFIPAYFHVAQAFRLPPMIFRLDEAGWQREARMSPEMAAIAAHFVRELEGNGVPLLDHLATIHLTYLEDRFELTKALFRQLEPGITHFILHPSKDTPELRAITPDWASRVADYEIFQSEELRKLIQQEGIQVIGYRPILELMQAS